MEKGQKASFVIESDESLANAIRRSVNKIQTLAIDSVEIHKNDSALYDEILGHRLGLIPIKSNRKLDKLEKGAKPTSKNQLQITLKAKGPVTVYSKDLKGDIEVIYGDIPIVILDKDQELELIAFAQLGDGNSHAKFSPGLTYYRNVSEIKVKNSEKAKEILEKIGENGNVKQGEVVVSNHDVDYIESLDDGEGVEVKPGKDIVFFVESWGQLTAKEIFQEATKSLNKNLKDVLKAVK
jgi:DNA-directed RNA polymerase subunit D